MAVTTLVDGAGDATDDWSTTPLPSFENTCDHTGSKSLAWYRRLWRPRARRMTGASELNEANAAPVLSDAIMAAAAPVRRLAQMMGAAGGN